LLYAWHTPDPAASTGMGMQADQPAGEETPDPKNLTIESCDVSLVQANTCGCQPADPVPQLRAHAWGYAA
jgi:hypothetical protein